MTALNEQRMLSNLLTTSLIVGRHAGFSTVITSTNGLQDITILSEETVKSGRLVNLKLHKMFMNEISTGINIRMEKRRDKPSLIKS